jgi:polar amino acid transport system substrate-binding protein
MQSVYRDLAPSGTLRAAINFGNSLVAHRDPASGEPRGIAVDLLVELTRRLSVPYSVLPFDGVLGILEAASAGTWDVAFLAIDPVRAQRLSFTSAYLAFEGTYAVRDNSANRTIFDLDREGVRIAVAEGATYDLHLTRTLRHAQLVRCRTFTTALDLFLSEGLDAVAGLKQALAAFAHEHHGLHLIEGRFAAIEHAMAVPKERSAGLRYLQAFLQDMKASGQIASLLEGPADTGVAAPASGPH